MMISITFRFTNLVTNSRNVVRIYIRIYIYIIISSSSSSSSSSSIIIIINVIIIIIIIIIILIIFVSVRVIFMIKVIRKNICACLFSVHNTSLHVMNKYV